MIEQTPPKPLTREEHIKHAKNYWTLMHIYAMNQKNKSTPGPGGVTVFQRISQLVPWDAPRTHEARMELLDVEFAEAASRVIERNVAKFFFEEDTRLLQITAQANGLADRDCRGTAPQEFVWPVPPIISEDDPRREETERQTLDQIMAKAGLKQARQ